MKWLQEIDKDGIISIEKNPKMYIPMNEIIIYYPHNVQTGFHNSEYWYLNRCWVDLYHVSSSEPSLKKHAPLTFYVYMKNDFIF